MWQVTYLPRPPTLRYPTKVVMWGRVSNVVNHVNSTKSVRGFWLAEGSKSALFLCLALWLIHVWQDMAIRPNPWCSCSDCSCHSCIIMKPTGGCRSCIPERKDPQTKTVCTRDERSRKLRTQAITGCCLKTSTITYCTRCDWRKTTTLNTAFFSETIKPFFTKFPVAIRKFCLAYLRNIMTFY